MTSISVKTGSLAILLLLSAWALSSISTCAHARERLHDEAWRVGPPASSERPFKRDAQQNAGGLSQSFPHTEEISDRRPPVSRAVEIKEGDKRLSRSKDKLRKEASSSASLTKPLPSRFELINKAYRDASGILLEDNVCSRFFGGSQAALVLAKLAEQLHLTKLEFGVGIRMSNRFTTIEDAANKIKYRLFDRAEVNSAGPFAWKQMSPVYESVPNVGSFQADTREVRTLMLLHELGHLLKGSDGNWLLPDDGNNEERSRENTLTIEAKCGNQIRALSNHKTNSTLTELQ